MTDRQRIVILGAGFAGLETAFLLRMRMRDAAELVCVSDRQGFTVRPNTIYVPFGADPGDLVVDLEKPFHRRHITHIHDRVVGVDPDAHAASIDAISSWGAGPASVPPRLSGSSVMIV